MQIVFGDWNKKWHPKHLRYKVQENDDYGFVDHGKFCLCDRGIQQPLKQSPRIALSSVLHSTTGTNRNRDGGKEVNDLASN